MNKAFTANINEQVTARGYLDENNQLIMLEPEMSGGGGYTTIYESAEAAFEYVSGSYPYAQLNARVNISNNMLYKITLDNTVLLFGTSGAGAVNSFDVPEIVIDDVYYYPSLTNEGYFQVNSSDNTALEAWAASTHSVKIEGMGY